MQKVLFIWVFGLQLPILTAKCRFSFSFFQTFVTKKGLCVHSTNLLLIDGWFSYWVLFFRGTLTGPSDVRYPEVVFQVANNLLVLVACCTDALSLSVQVLSSCRNTTEVINVF